MVFSLIRLRAKSSASEQRGFALSEVLVAAAILAAVLAVISTGLSNGLRLSRASEDRQSTIHEARNIAARLQAGLPHEELLADMENWEIRYIPLGDNNPARSDSAMPVEVTVVHTGSAAFQFTTVILLTGEDLERRQ